MNRSNTHVVLSPLLLSVALAGLAACSSNDAVPSPNASGTSATEPSATAGDAGDGDAATADPPEQVDALATKLHQWLAGRFDSVDQAKRDTTYREITLAVCEVPAPDLAPSGAPGQPVRALYVEQAIMGSPPYRQRMYLIEPQTASSARSLVFELANPQKVVGLCDQAKDKRAAFRSADVVARPGCHVEMHWVGDHFVGHTPDARWDGAAFTKDPDGEKCPSSLEGASYATSNVELRQDTLRSWDQGWDSKNKQVWGATKGPYEFVRRP